MRAGRLRHFVWFDELVVTHDTDSDDEETREETWLPLFGGQAISADITALSGKELIAAEGVQSKVSTRIKVRYREGFTARMRVRHRTTVYNVEAIIPDPDSGFTWVTLLCSSGVSPGN